MWQLTKRVDVILNGRYNVGYSSFKIITFIYSSWYWRIWCLFYYPIVPHPLSQCAHIQNITIMVVHIVTCWEDLEEWIFLYFRMKIKYESINRLIVIFFKACKFTGRQIVFRIASFYLRVRLCLQLVATITRQMSTELQARQPTVVILAVIVHVYHFLVHLVKFQKRLLILKITYHFHLRKLKFLTIYI